MEERLSLLKGNIAKLYALYGLNGSLLSISIIVPFYQENGLSLQEVFLLQGLFGLTMAVLEIPSGYLSDRWGRKPTLVIASIALFAAIVIYCLSHDFAGFLLAEMILAIGFSFNSGTLEAMTYDTLLEMNQTDQYRRIHGTQSFLYFGMEAVGAVIAGGLALLSLRTPFFATLLTFGSSVLVALTLVEPERHKIQETRHFKKMWDITTHTLLHSRTLGSIVLLSSILSALMLSLFWFSQPYELMIGLPLAYFGIVHAITCGSGGIAAKYLPNLSKKIDDRWFLVFIAATLVGSYITLGFVASLWGLLLFFVSRVAWGFLSPLTSDIVNRLTTSDIRATVLSVRAFLHRVIFVAVAPLLGYMADLHGIQPVMLTTGIVGGILLVIVFLMMRTVWANIPQ